MKTKLFLLFILISFSFALALEKNPFNHVVDYDNLVLNTPYEYMYRDSGKKIMIENVPITGTGEVNLNVFKFTGTVRVLNQYAVITEVTTLTNMTGVYADLYDGTNEVELTSDGAVLSGCGVGTFFSKTAATDEIYTVASVNAVSLIEEQADRIGMPFTITAKSGVDNYIRFNFTTTDAPINFKMSVYFEYELINGGTLEIAG